MDFLVNQWPVITAVAAVIAALVVFGKNLADMILKWRAVLGGSTTEANREDSSAVEEFSEGIVLSRGNYQAVSLSGNEGNLQKFKIKNSGVEITYREVLEFWEGDEEFTDFYINIFKKCGFSSYIWETPPISNISLDQIFEFVILNTPKYSSNPDRETFREFFDKNSKNKGVVSFLNLGHDAMLVVPSPLRPGANYSGLAEFYRESPLDQQRALWKEVARQLKIKLTNKNIWVSVAGGGISWLHIRLDDKPKYYRHMPYANRS